MEAKPMKRFFAKGRLTRRVPGAMSGTEKKYASQLEADKLAGVIVSYRFEAVKLRLADKTFYTPDFYVLMPDGSIELREVKGSWNAPNQDMSRVKIKVAAEQFPEFVFVAVVPRRVKDGGGWSREEF